MAVVLNRSAAVEDTGNCYEEEEDQKRNWDNMPEDVLSLIFMKLGALHILYSAQSVCSSWRKLSKEPYFFRSIDFCNNQWDNLLESLQPDLYDYAVQKISQEAVDRSCGQLAQLFLDDYCTDEILLYSLERSNSLKHLRFTPSECMVYEYPRYQLNVVLEKFTFLEELELCGYMSVAVIQRVCGVCSQLKSLRLIDCFGDFLDAAFVIADKMPQLRRLHISGIGLTDISLQTLLNGCHYLEYLDLGECYNTGIGEEIQKKCRNKLKFVALPDDLRMHDDGDDDYCSIGDFDGDDDYCSIGDFDGDSLCCCSCSSGQPYSDFDDYIEEMDFSDDYIEEMADTFEEKWKRHTIGKR